MVETNFKSLFQNQIHSMPKSKMAHIEMGYGSIEQSRTSKIHKFHDSYISYYLRFYKTKYAACVFYSNSWSKIPTLFENHRNLLHLKNFVKFFFTLKNLIKVSCYHHK